MKRLRCRVVGLDAHFAAFDDGRVLLVVGHVTIDVADLLRAMPDALERYAPTYDAHGVAVPDTVRVERVALNEHDADRIGLLRERIERAGA